MNQLLNQNIMTSLLVIVTNKKQGVSESKYVTPYVESAKYEQIHTAAKEIRKQKKWDEADCQTEWKETTV